MEPAGFSLREPERTSPTEVSSGVRSAPGWVTEGVTVIEREKASKLR